MLQNFEQIFAPSLDGVRIGNKKELQCYCPFHSHNHNTPSMSVNTETGRWTCFVCGDGHGGKGAGYVSYYAWTRNISISQALKDLNEFDENYKNRPIVTHSQPVVKEVELDPDYTDYIINQLSATMLHEQRYKFYGQKLYELRGITYPTAVACAISYDVNKGWLFPIMRYKGNGSICGYEVRKKDFTKFSGGNKCFRGEGSPKCLSVVYQPIGDSKRTVICEGYIDAAFMYQMLHENAQRKHGALVQVDRVIITPSHGVSMLPGLIEELELWNDFDEVLIVTDNDTAGNKAKNAIKDLGHNDVFKYFNGLNEDEDFEEWYKRKNMM